MELEAMEPAAGRIDPMRLFQRGKKRDGGAARSEGFTLLEVLLSLVLTALILAGIYNMFANDIAKFAARVDFPSPGVGLVT